MKVFLNALPEIPSLARSVCVVLISLFCAVGCKKASSGGSLLLEPQSPSSGQLTAIPEQEEARLDLTVPASRDDMTKLSEADIADALNAQMAGRHQEALNHYLKVIERGTVHRGLNYQIGVALYQLERSKEAVPYFEKSAAAGEEACNALNMLGIIDANAGEYDQAMKRFAEAMKADSYSPQPYFNAGETLRRMAKYPEAAAMYQEAVRRKPEEPLFSFKLHLTEMDLPDNLEVLAAIKRELASDAPTGDWLLLAGYELARKNDFDGAAARWQQALDSMTPGVFFAMLDDPVFTPLKTQPALARFFAAPGQVPSSAH